MVDQKASWDSSELENLFFLRGVDFGSVRGLLEECPLRVLKPEEIFLQAGERNESLYLLLSGRLRIHLQLDADPITILNPGDVVGELSLIDKQLTAAHVVADESCRLLVLDEETMWSLMDASPVARNLLFLLARRVRHGDDLLITSQQLQRQYEHYSTTDALTGLYNRRWLNRTLERQVERSLEGPKRPGPAGDRRGLLQRVQRRTGARGGRPCPLYGRSDGSGEPASRRDYCSFWG
jgi:CRP-like cAMP-binding protein